MITKWTLQEEIPLPATSPWHEVPEGVHENVVFPVPIIRLSSLPRKARRMRWSTVALASTIILHEPTQAGETYQKLVAYDEQSAENFEKVCYNYHGILCGIWRKGG